MTDEWADIKARDWLEHHMTGDDDGDRLHLAALLKSVDDEARRDERERCSGHHQMMTTARCFECGDDWPCITVRRIRAQREEGR